MRESFEGLFAGQWTPNQISAFLTAISLKDMTSDLLVAAALAMRTHMIRVELWNPNLIDTCGTGGDGLKTANISTAAAIVVAACGIPVAKHGNRSASGTVGSADVIEALGIPVSLQPDIHKQLINEIGITFLYARDFHPSLGPVASIRRELGIRTVFNAVGPLVNPAMPAYQLVGVPDPAWLEPVSDALRELGAKRAWVVHGSNGLDEINPCGTTTIRMADQDGARIIQVSPELFGVKEVNLPDIVGTDAKGNADLIESVLSGEYHPLEEAIVLNAAAALMVVDSGLEPVLAASKARNAIREQSAYSILKHWRESAQSLIKTA